MKKFSVSVNTATQMVKKIDWV